MADQNPSGGNGTLIFIVGGLVVAVGVIAYVLMGGDVDVASDGGGGDVNVSVESTSESAEPAEPAEPADDAGSDTGADDSSSN